MMRYKVTAPRHSGQHPVQSLLWITYYLRCIQFLVRSNMREVFLSDFQCEVMVLISAVTAAMIKMADSNSAAFMH